MTETIHKLDAAYQKLMTIPVAGIYVEPMATAMALLREVYTEMKKEGEAECEK